jgi:hypothetical protein
VNAPRGVVSSRKVIGAGDPTSHSLLCSAALFRSECPWTKFQGVGERSTLRLFTEKANEPFENDFVFQQIADEAPDFPLA